MSYYFFDKYKKVVDVCKKMGIQIKGSNDTISASDGSMVLEGSALTFDNESITGISTMATGHITGTATIDK